MTDFSEQCELLSQIWTDYRHNENWADFIDFNDIGLPLAYFIHEDIVQVTPEAEAYIVETFKLLVYALQADPEADFDTLQDLLIQFGD